MINQYFHESAILYYLTFINDFWRIGLASDLTERVSGKWDFSIQMTNLGRKKRMKRDENIVVLESAQRLVLMELM